MGSVTVLAQPSLDELEATNTRRIEALNASGFVLPGLDEHYLIELLEQMLSPAQIHDAKLRQVAWVSAELDRVESAIRRGILTAPVSPSGRRPSL